MDKEQIDFVLENAKAGKATLATFEGVVAVDIDKLISQPADGILYDLNRLEESTISRDGTDLRWINDFAVAKVIRRLRQEVERLRDKLHQIKTWTEAYPLDIFIEPDLKKAAEILKASGMTLGSISASSMRHVLNGIARIIEESED